jgi:hypothetical protein
MARKTLSDAANEYRQAMWASGVVGLVALGLASLAAQGIPPRAYGILGLGVGTATLLLSAWFGIRARQQALKDQEVAARRSMIVMLAAQLGSQDDETLAKIVLRGGPAAEAASLILKGRRERREGGAAPA